MAKIAVTGAGGFIGSNVVQELIKRGHTVRGIDAKFPEDRKPLLAGAELISADLRNSGVAEHVFEDMEMVVHLASNMGGVGYFTYNDYYPFIDNMQMDMNVLLGAEKRGVKRLFYASSACIYPTHIQMEEGNAPKLNERMVYPANSDLSYGWEKLMMLRLCERSPLDARVGILHTVYGVHQESQGQRMKAPTALATKAIKSKETGTFEIWGNGKQIRSFCYITDAVEKNTASAVFRPLHGGG